MGVIFGCPHTSGPVAYLFAPAGGVGRGVTECSSVTFLLEVNMNQSLLPNLRLPVCVTNSAAFVSFLSGE